LPEEKNSESNLPEFRKKLNSGKFGFLILVKAAVNGFFCRQPPLYYFKALFYL